jgi:hypothetical protein
VYDGDLFVGGQFSSAGGVSTGTLAGWDGSAWTEVGGGTTGATVTALAVYDDRLIVAGGNNLTFGGQAGFNGIAAWDGQSWSPLGAGPGDPVQGSDIWALMPYEGDLVAAGFFLRYSLNAHHVARWNGSTWETMGDFGVNSAVESLTLHNGVLYAGTWRGVYRWTGDRWQPLGPPFHYEVAEGEHGIVFAVTSAGGSLWAGGSFGTLGDRPSVGVGRWTD